MKTRTHRSLLSRILSPAAILLVLPMISTSQSVGTFIEQLLEAPQAQRQSRADQYLSDHPTNPLCDSDTVAVLLYSGAAGSVSMAGDASAWRPDIDVFTNVPGTSLWYGAFAYEPDARLDYKLVIDGSSWVLDPRNPLRSRGGFGENSELRMPAYVGHPELLVREDVPRGILRDTVFYGNELGNSRRVRLYLPAGYERGSDSLGIVVVHDGLEFIDIADMPTVLDNLIADGHIPPILALFIPPVDRSSEYAGERMEIFARYITEEVLPAYRARYRISADPSRSIVMGASNGGNISLFMAMSYPKLFGNVIAFSSNVVPPVADRYADPNVLPVRVYLDIGTYDIPQLMPRVRSFRQVLEDRGYDHQYAEFHEGHSWANWRSHIDDALQYLLVPQ